MKNLNSIMFLALGIAFIGCSNSKKVAQKEIQDTKEEVRKTVMDNAVDFYAEAEDKSWKLSILYDRDIIFNDTKNDVYFYAPSNEKIVASGANVVNVFAQNEKYIIRVNIDIEDCGKEGKITNIMVRENNKKNGIDYEGCGTYLGAPRIHDIWVVEEINGKKLKPEQFPKELPHFEFNLVEKRMSGFAGCNQVNGTLQFDYDVLKINSLMSTRMYCANISEIEESILNVMRNNPIYHFDNLYLWLETQEGSIKLKKVD